MKLIASILFEQLLPFVLQIPHAAGDVALLYTQLEPSKILSAELSWRIPPGVSTAISFL